MPLGQSIGLGYQAGQISHVSSLGSFFSLFYLKKMPTMATSKQIPNQPSYLGTIQAVSVPCLASPCEAMCPSPKPGHCI